MGAGSPPVIEYCQASLRGVGNPVISGMQMVDQGWFRATRDHPTRRRPGVACEVKTVLNGWESAMRRWDQGIESTNETRTQLFSHFELGHESRLWSTTGE